MSTVREAALRIAGAGRPVLPIVARGKVPLTPHGLRDATTDVGRIESWWSTHPDANLGMRCDGLLVIDVDPGGEEALLALQSEHEPLPATREQRTPRGGRHLFYRLPEGVQVGNSTRPLGRPVGLDLRAGTAGYVVVAPSRNGDGGYEWANTLPIADCPAWLLGRLQRPERTEPLVAPVLAADRSAYGRAALEAEVERVRGAVEGQRNEVLNQSAFALGQLEAGGELVYGDAEAALVVAGVNAGLSETEARRTVRSGVEAGRGSPRTAPPRATKHETPATSGRGAVVLQPGRTDLANAELFALQHSGRMRHVRERRAWLAWDGRCWRPDVTGAAERAAKDTARHLLREAVEQSDGHADGLKWAVSVQAEQRIRAMLTLASTESSIALAADTLDLDPFLLSCANGTLDLRTGKLRAHDPDDLITLATSVPYEPDARCDRWLRFLDEIFDGDAELVGFVRRLVGYCLTGDTGEHVFFVLHGTGCNGKTTFVEKLKGLLGDHSATASFDSFIRRRGDSSVRNDLARLHRARAVIASESGEGKRLDEATVKTLTGGDTIASRFLYAEYFEYKPRFKLVLVTNHRPRVDGDDDAIWRRIRLVPFNASFEGREDHWLGQTLDRELPGILNWAVEGCLEWQRDGLTAPTAVLNATSEYRQEEDSFGAFLEQHCDINPNATVEAARLRDAYDTYCREVGDRPLTPNSFGKRLAKRDIRSASNNGTRTYTGIGLRP